jgi:hypothetical protein
VAPVAAAPTVEAATQAGEPRPIPPPPPSAISPLALVPREPLGLPLVAWFGGAIYLFILILVLGSLL